MYVSTTAIRHLRAAAPPSRFGAHSVPLQIGQGHATNEATRRPRDDLPFRGVAWLAPPLRRGLRSGEWPVGWSFEDQVEVA